MNGDLCTVFLFTLFLNIIKIFDKIVSSELRCFIKKSPDKRDFLIGWGGWVRTNEWRYQKPLPYHLATPQQRCDFQIKYGALGEIRTHDPCLRRAILYPAELQAHCLCPKIGGIIQDIFDKCKSFLSIYALRERHTRYDGWLRAAFPAIP